MIQDRAIVWNVTRKPYLSKFLNCTIFSDLEWPLTHISRSLHYLTLNLRNGTRYRHSCNGILKGTYLYMFSSRDKGVISIDIDWSWVTYQNIQWHEASRSVSATPKLLVDKPNSAVYYRCSENPSCTSGGISEVVVVRRTRKNSRMRCYSFHSRRHTYDEHLTAASHVRVLFL